MEDGRRRRRGEDLDISGERQLLRTLLDLAIEDQRLGCPDASAWFWGEPLEPRILLTFEDVCDWLGIEPDHVRRLLHLARPSRTRRRATFGRGERRVDGVDGEDGEDGE